MDELTKAEAKPIGKEPGDHWLREIAQRLRGALPIFVSVLVSFGIGAVLLLLTGQNPIDAYRGLWEGAFGSRNAFAGTLTATTPLIFSALAFLIAFRAGVFNAGTEGQLLIGAFWAAWAGFSISGLPPVIHIPIVFLAGVVGGALWAFLPGLWRIYFGVNEIVTTLMMNYIAVLLNNYLVLNVFRNPAVQPGTNAQTPNLAAAATLPSLFPPYAVTLALPLSIVLAVALYWLLHRTVFGYELRMGGQQPNFARYGGISTKRAALSAMLMSGALAGLGGAAQVGGVFHAYVTPFTEGLGFNGVLIALLTKNNPLAAPIGSFFFGALQSGALKMQIFTDVSRYIIGVLTGTFVLFASAQHMGFLQRGALGRSFVWLQRKIGVGANTRSS